MQAILLGLRLNNGVSCLFRNGFYPDTARLQLGKAPRTAASTAIAEQTGFE